MRSCAGSDCCVIASPQGVAIRFLRSIDKHTLPSGRTDCRVAPSSLLAMTSVGCWFCENNSIVPKGHLNCQLSIVNCQLKILPSTGARRRRHGTRVVANRNRLADGQWPPLLRGATHVRGKIPLEFRPNGTARRLGGCPSSGAAGKRLSAVASLSVAVHRATAPVSSPYGIIAGSFWAGSFLSNPDRLAAGRESAFPQRQCWWRRGHYSGRKGAASE